MGKVKRKKYIYFIRRKKVSIPYGKGKAVVYAVVIGAVTMYQFPMGKVKFRVDGDEVKLEKGINSLWER